MSRLLRVADGPYAPPVPARELTVTAADGARVHVEVHGPENAPAVVLAHGWCCSTAFWAAQIRALAADHRVIAYDQRGHGRSPANPAYGTEPLADDLEAVLEATLAPGERAVIAGHSMGGMTLMAAATRPAVREHAAAVLLTSTGSARLVASATVVPMRAGRVRTWLTRRILGSRAPLGPVTPLARRILKYGTMGPGSAPHMVDACARIVHSCPSRVRHGWSQVLDLLDLDHGVRELRMPHGDRGRYGGPADAARARPRAGRRAARLRGPDGTPGSRPHDAGGGPGPGHRQDTGARRHLHTQRTR